MKMMMNKKKKIHKLKKGTRVDEATLHTFINEKGKKGRMRRTKTKKKGKEGTQGIRTSSTLGS